MFPSQTAKIMGGGLLRRSSTMIFILNLTLACQLLATIAVNGQQYSYTRDCIDQHHKEVKCVVQLVDCDSDDQLPDHVNDSNLVPEEAHDIRVEPFAKAISRRQAESYQLSVDISWQTPPNNSTRLLKGFFLEIESADQKTHLCFLFNVSESNWTAQAISSSPRLHFSTENLFRFAQTYEVRVSSLPESANLTRVAKKRVVMPHNPRVTNFSNLVSPNCSQYSHPYASKWTAGFRRIIIHSITRAIQIEFVGAPAQYCFEQYEVRLLDETGLELLHSDLISVDQMSSERIDNTTVYFGQYNFTNLEMDRTYIPSVIAVERASDGRCLCPEHGSNPYDNAVVCSCIAADWKPVKLTKVPRGDRVVINSTIPLMTVDDQPDSNGWAVYVALALSIVGVMTCVAFLLLAAYRHYGARGKTVRIRFIQDRARASSGASLPSHGHFDSQGKALLEASNGPLTASNNVNLLLVYAHDSAEHEAAVRALADFLREAFGFDVHMDTYDADKIERNLMDYLSSSVVNADKILIVNSLGAAQRYHTKIQSAPGAHFLVERNEPTPFDGLFTQQIDMALQHHSLVSVRFDYSAFREVLPPLHGYLQYVLPGNLAPLMSALTASGNLKNDARLAASTSPPLQRLLAAVSLQRELVERDADWFARSHHRRRVAPLASARHASARDTALASLLPSLSTLPTLSVGDGDADEDEESVGDAADLPTAAAAEDDEFEAEARVAISAGGDRVALLIGGDDDDENAASTRARVADAAKPAPASPPPPLANGAGVERDANDSGVYDEDFYARMESGGAMASTSADVEARLAANEPATDHGKQRENVFEMEKARALEAQTRLPNAEEEERRIEMNAQYEAKRRARPDAEDAMDSGLVSDADLQQHNHNNNDMISAI